MDKTMSEFENHLKSVVDSAFAPDMAVQSAPRPVSARRITFLYFADNDGTIRNEQSPMAFVKEDPSLLSDLVLRKTVFPSGDTMVEPYVE